MEEKILFSNETKGCVQDKVILKKIVLFDNTMSIEIPIELNNMPLEMIDKFYPYDERPSIIKSTEDGKVQLTFQMFESILAEDNVYAAIESIRKLMDSVYPDYWMSNIYLFHERNTLIGWYVSEMENEFGKIRHVKYVTSIKGCFILGTITYPKDYAKKWEAIVKHIYLSIKENIL